MRDWIGNGDRLKTLCIRMSWLSRSLQTIGSINASTSLITDVNNKDSGVDLRHTAGNGGHKIQPPFSMSSEASQRYKHKRWIRPGSKQSRLYPDFTIQDLHHPLALTTFPGNMAHGPHSVPAAPV